MVRRAISAGIGVVLLASTGSAGAQAATLDELLDALAARGAVVARFEEQRQLAFLERPLVSWGTISFSPPDELIKQTLGPEPSLARIEGDRLLIVDGSGERQLSLDSDPAIRVYVAPFRAVLAGDRASLERHYDIAAELGSSWSLKLTPRSAEVAQRIERIAIAGRDDRVERIEIREPGGHAISLQLSETGQ